MRPKPRATSSIPRQLAIAHQAQSIAKSHPPPTRLKPPAPSRPASPGRRNARRLNEAERWLLQSIPTSLETPSQSSLFGECRILYRPQKIGAQGPRNHNESIAPLSSPQSLTGDFMLQRVG